MEKLLENLENSINAHDYNMEVGSIDTSNFYINIIDRKQGFYEILEELSILLEEIRSNNKEIIDLFINPFDRDNDFVITIEWNI